MDCTGQNFSKMFNIQFQAPSLQQNMTLIATLHCPNRIRRIPQALRLSMRTKTPGASPSEPLE